MRKCLNERLFWPTFALLILFLSIIQYYGLIRYHYLVPPGHDAMMHWYMIQPYYEGKLTFLEAWKNGSYPPLFLITTAALAHLFKTDPMQIMLWCTPSILIFSAISIFAFTYKAFGKYPALITFLLYSFAGKIAQQQLNDGGYPNLIAAQIFIPLMFLLLLLFQKEKGGKKILYLFLTLLVSVLIVLCHHISALYLIMIISLGLPVYLIRAWVTNKWKAIKGISILTIIFLFYFFLGYLFLKTDIFTPIRALSDSMIRFQNNFPFVKLVGIRDPEAILSFTSYPQYIGEPIFIFGVLGLTLLPLLTKKKISNLFLPYLLVTIWAILLLVGSRMSFLTNPDRLVRDLIVPLSILSGAFIYNLWILFQGKKHILNKIILAVFVIGLSILPVTYRIKNAMAYEPMVRITDADSKAIDFLKNQKPSNILIEGYSFYFNYFLPDWTVGYLWSPQTEQDSSVHPFDPSNANELKQLEQYSYIYIVNSQKGWAPKAVRYNFVANYLNNSRLTLIGNYKSRTNDVYLFKVKN